MDEFNTNNTTRSWVAIGCAAAVILTLCCAGGIVGGLYWLGSQTTEGLAQINVEAPINADTGKAYAITVTVRNISGKDIVLNSVDISQNLLNGFIIVSVDPPYVETYEYGSGGGAYQTYTFETVIPAGESLTVRFEGKAAFPGDFGGEFDVCINSIINCHTSIIRTIVK